MNLLLLENPNYCIKPFLAQVTGYPNSSRININNNNYFECLKIIETPPVLTKKWLVIISPRLSGKQIANLMERDNNNVVPLITKGKWQELAEELKDLGVNFKLLDNLNPNKDDIIEYVTKHLPITYEDAKYLAGRHRYYLPKVMESVDLLTGLDIVTREKIREYTDRFNSVWISSITENILGVDTKISKKRLVALIYDFRYGFDYVLTSIKNDLDMYMYIYSEMIDGNLTLENYIDFESDNKKFKNLPNFRKLKIIESFDVVSYDKLFYVKTKVESISNKPNNIYKLIKLIGGVPHVRPN
ncbi:hypothetical protein UT300012_23130 [Paraclostridium bifermentans]